jgi:tRNA-specific 2-thiouridylase
MTSSKRVIVALSGGVDSAVAAWSLADAGHAVECLHMSNWDDDDGYCDAAADLGDARDVCDRLGLHLHRVNFAREYRELVFADFLDEIRAGLTPNPDVLCNREIKFGLMARYARRLGADQLATGHYARVERDSGETMLMRGRDRDKDQSYFLHAVRSKDLAGVLFPLGDKTKGEVRALARRAGLRVADKRDSTGICFIGERPFGAFLSAYLEPNPGPIVTLEGEVVGEHQGLQFYTLGQRKGIGIGGLASAGNSPWYVAGKRLADNELVVVQGHDHPALFSDWIEIGPVNWIGPEPAKSRAGTGLRCEAKTRYRQPGQPCTLAGDGHGATRVAFDRPQRAVAPGQSAVFYIGDRCLGGAPIVRTGREDTACLVAEAG